MTQARTLLSSASKRSLPLAALALILPACAYQPARYDGDGQITASRTAPYRHEIEFPPIPLTTPGTHTFRLSGLPLEHMAAVLRISDPSAPVMDALEKAGVRVRMTVVNLADGSTSVKEGRLLADWNTTYEGLVGSVQGVPDEFEGVWFRPRRHDAFTLTIDVAVTRPEAATLPVSATPRVRGKAGDAVGGLGNHLPNPAGGS